MSDDDKAQYRPTGMTVWFERDPGEFKTNPFDIVSEFGKVNTIGRGNSFDEAEVYRQALEEIMDIHGYGKEFEIAEAAIESIRLLPKRGAAA